MGYTTVFFDLDGTLIDPKVGITKAVQYALDKFGIKADTEELLPFIGPPLNKSFQKYYGFDEKKSMEAVLHYREYLIPKGIQESTVYEGIPGLLVELGASGKKLAVVTSKPTYIAEQVLRHHGLDQYFEIVMGCKPDLSNAAKGLLIEEALMLHPGEDKQSVVMIGDREHDIIGAKANGIDSVGVLYGYGPGDEIANANPTHIARSVGDLKPLL